MMAAKIGGATPAVSWKLIRLFVTFLSDWAERESPLLTLKPDFLTAPINWWERTESNDVPMQVTWFTAKRPPLVLTPKIGWHGWI
jgi:hypothetical protein